MKESDILKAIMDLLAARGFRIFRRNVMGVVPVKGGAIRLGQRGMADLYGWERYTGRHIEVEVKRPKARTSPARAALQAAWLEAAWQDGCIAFQTDSVADCKKKLMDFGLLREEAV